MPVPYHVDISGVASEVRTFSKDELQWWAVCLEEIALNPFPRWGTYLERIARIRGLPGRIYLYDIVREVSTVSEEVVYAFTAEFFPWHILVYVVNEDDNEVNIIFLRENHLV